MKTPTVPLPDPLAAGTSKPPPAPDDIADLIGAVDGLPPDLSSRWKEHMRRAGYGRKRPR